MTFERFDKLRSDVSVKVIEAVMAIDVDWTGRAEPRRWSVLEKETPTISEVFQTNVNTSRTFERL